jgi:hypothetical protein
MLRLLWTSSWMPLKVGRASIGFKIFIMQFSAKWVQLQN